MSQKNPIEKSIVREWGVDQPRRPWGFPPEPICTKPDQKASFRNKFLKIPAKIPLVSTFRYQRRRT